LDIVDAMSTVKELMLSDGIVFEPLGAAPDEFDDEQAAATRLTAATRPTQPTRRQRANVLPDRIL
jgi:hypothetical protein